MSNFVTDAFYSLGKNINKRFGGDQLETQEGVVSEKLPELSLDMPNDKILTLAKKWEDGWKHSAVYQEWMAKGEKNEKYWLGKQHDLPKANGNALVDNVIFEALETYLPQVTQHNPEPMVALDESEQPSPENLEYATHLKKELAELADDLKLRLKLKKAGRHWAIYLLGAAKFGWDLNKDCPTVKIVRPQKLILVENSTVDEDGYTGEVIGEYRKLEAGIMIDMLKNIGGEADAEKVITELCDSELGTEIQFIEWWTDEYMCWTLKDHVLLKKKNPHWNYDQETPGEPQTDPTTGQPMLDEQGQPVAGQAQTEPGFNHLAKPSKPYLLLSVFNLGKQPVDETSLISQNISSQDLINKRLRQIDKNADSMNGGMVVSLERSGLTTQQVKGVTAALRAGGTVAIPAGAVNEAIARMSAPGLPNEVFAQLSDTRARVSYIFGTKGFQPNSGGSSQSAVRSQIINQNLDTARISGGFSEYLEQFADDIYNWFIQLLYVYDDEFGGKPHPKIKLTIKEGSLLPKDANALATQAIQLASNGKMALIDLYKKLEYPNPEEMASNVWLEANAPEVLFANDPRVAQVIQQRQQSQQGAGDKINETVNFKDLPPDAQAQFLKKIGIDAHPEAIAAHAEVVHQRSNPPQPQPQVDNNGYVTPQ